MVDDQTIRVLEDHPLDGPTNMARDEALLNLVGSGASPATLRLYQWNEPTVSLGYFQRFADFRALPAPAGDLPVVRRLTGGGAILHDWELTYSLALPVHHVLISEGPNHLYEWAHDAVIAMLGSINVRADRCGQSDDSTPTRGPFLCFERRHRFDVLVGKDKIAGSAQRRRRDAILQHGSIVLGNRFKQHPTAVIGGAFEKHIKWAKTRFVRELAKQSDLIFEVGTWEPEELVAADALVAKYARNEWTGRT